MNPSEFDVAVVGAGPAGAVTALCLAREGVRVVVVDNPPSSEPVGDHLPGELKPLLSRLGLSGLVEATSAVPSSGVVSVWGDSQPYRKPGLFSPYGAGWHVDRVRYQAALRNEAAAAGARFLRPARVLAVEGEAGQWTLAVHGVEREIRAEWLLDATGRTAWLGRQLSSAPRVIDTLHAFVRRAQTPVEPHALVEANPTGWFYSAPLPAGRAVVMYFTDAKLGGARCWATWWEGSHTQARFQGHELGPVRAYRATSQWSVLRRAEGWLPIGDAALARDPLSSKGLAGAFQSAADAAQVVLGAMPIEDYFAGLDRDIELYLQRRTRAYRNGMPAEAPPFWSQRSG